MSSVPTYVYSTEEDIAHIKQILAKLSPASIALLRRIQSPRRVKETVIQATFPPGTPIAALPSSYAISYFGRDPLSSLDAFLFTSLELKHQDAVTPADRQETWTQLLSLFRAWLSAQENWSLLPKQTESPDSIMQSPSIAFIASLHARNAAILREHGCARDEVGGPGGPYRKLTFKVDDSDSDPEDALSPTLEWDVAREQDYGVIVATNDIISFPASLTHCPSVVVRDSGDEGRRAVAWAFMGSDGSIRTAYTLPEYRHRGLMRKVVRRLVRQCSSVYAGDGTCHGDISPTNEASQALFRSLGGSHLGDYYWVRVDLER